MFSLTLENKNGDQLTFGQNSPLTVTDIQGLNPPEATINTNQVALIDGARFNSAKLNMRTINVAFAIEYSAAYNRIEVFKVLKSKQYVKLYYKGDYRNVWIEGYIQRIDITYFEKKQVVTCAIICPSPYFKEAQMIINEINNIINTFHFPFASTEDPELVFGYLSNDVSVFIENDGDVDCGMVIELYARAAVSNPKVWNYITREFIGLNYSLQTADLITIDTRQGQKSVTLLRNGAESNLFNYVVQGSTWLQLSASGDTFVYEVETGNNADLGVTFKHDNLYEGV
jgi:hypothetical protein